jgi:hypothetical protein
LFSVIQKKGTEDEIVRSSLVLGEIGVYVDLSSINGIIGSVSQLFEHADD